MKPTNWTELEDSRLHHLIGNLGCSYFTAAAHIGRTQGAVRTRWHRIRPRNESKNP